MPKDFKKLKPAEIDALVAEQITPGLWWDARVAAHCRLPLDGVVYHYHPVSVPRLVQPAAARRGGERGPGAAINVERRAAKCRKGITDDFGDKDGTSMRSSADVTEDPCNQKLTLQELVQGFDAPECAPVKRRRPTRRRRGAADAPRVRRDARCGGGRARAPRQAAQQPIPARPRGPGTTRWIGHC